MWHDYDINRSTKVSNLKAEVECSTMFEYSSPLKLYSSNLPFFTLGNLDLILIFETIN